MAEQPELGCGGSGCLLFFIILFAIGLYLAKQQGMDVSEIFRNFADIIGR